MTSVVPNKGTLELLKEGPRFQLLSRQELMDLVMSGRFREYRPGEIVIREGETDRWVYFLISGELEVIKENRTVGHLNCLGDLFGEMGVIDGSPRSTTVIAVTPAVTLGMDASLSNLDAGHGAFYPVMYRLFAEVLAMRLRNANEEILQLRKISG